MNYVRSTVCGSTADGMEAGYIKKTQKLLGNIRFIRRNRTRDRRLEFLDVKGNKVFPGQLV
jgi:hypothetical protein